MAAADPRLPISELGEGHHLPGVSESNDTFALDEIDAPALVLIVFDLYCPTCQKSAGNIKRLAETIQESTPSIAVLGIGSGDTPFEAKKFRDKFKLPIPCVSDREESVSRQYGVKRTPSLIVLDRADSGAPFTEIYRNEGYIGREHIEAVMALVEERK